MPTLDVAAALIIHHLLPPDLEMLSPTERRYTTLLMQPGGPIFATRDRIGPLETDVAYAKGRGFLGLASEHRVHLAVTPEYFLPWAVLKDAIGVGLIPATDALWVLGSESITQEGLEQFKQEVDSKCLILHEPWQNLPPNRNLLDPVVLLFQAIRQDQTVQLVALVQFKTYPSRDSTFFEEGLLRRGSLIYQFRGRIGNLKAAVIICSDAFALNDQWVRDFNDRSTLIHIQLNPNPRNSAYRQYRTTTFGTDARATNCHIVCLNWAHSVVQHGDPGTPTDAWNNIAGSTWYCPAEECSSDDAVVIPNHNHGLYYTYMKERRHALLFHYDEATFELQVPKLITLGSAVMANHNGPATFQRYEWNEATSTWTAGLAVPETGFNAFVDSDPSSKLALEHVLAEGNPLDIERVLALSTGAISGDLTWHSIQNIDSCQIAADEVVQRVTVIQDNEAYAFRHERLTSVAQIHHEILNSDYWPPQVAGVDLESSIRWTGMNPHFNVLTADGQLTLIVYLGESPPARDLETKADMLYELLRQAGGPHWKRLCIVYREFGQTRFAPIAALTLFDDAMEDMTDIMAVQPLEDMGANHG
jgi:hypothetical protein